MKMNKLLSLFLTVGIAFSSCKKDEEPAPSPGLPDGNYVKIGSTTYLENQWFSVEKLYDPVGERYTAKISLNQPKTQYFMVTFHDEPIVGNDYFLDGDLGLDKTDRAAVGYRSADGKNYSAQDNGSLTVTMKDGKKVIELHGNMSGIDNDLSADARFVWPD